MPLNAPLPLLPLLLPLLLPGLLLGLSLAASQDNLHLYLPGVFLNISFLWHFPHCTALHCTALQDLLLGGLFPIHKQGEDGTVCGDIQDEDGRKEEEKEKENDKEKMEEKKKEKEEKKDKKKKKEN
jgi:hypothetical protein